MFPSCIGVGSREYLGELGAIAMLGTVLSELGINEAFVL